MHRLRDETLQSIARRSTTYGPAARRILSRRVDGVTEQTATLSDLTERIRADIDTVRPLVKDHQPPGAYPENCALAELRRRFG